MNVINPDAPNRWGYIFGGIGGDVASNKSLETILARALSNNEAVMRIWWGSGPIQEREDNLWQIYHGNADYEPCKNRIRELLRLLRGNKPFNKQDWI